MHSKIGLYPSALVADGDLAQIGASAPTIGNGALCQPVSATSDATCRNSPGCTGARATGSQVSRHLADAGDKNPYLS